MSLIEDCQREIDDDDKDLKDYLATTDALFHDTKLTTAIEPILSRKRLRLSLISECKDPYEYRKQIIEVGAGTETTSQQARCGIRKTLRNILTSQVRVLCFCCNRMRSDDKHEACNPGWYTF
jgi:hypothetical protein